MDLIDQQVVLDLRFALTIQLQELLRASLPSQYPLQFIVALKTHATRETVYQVDAVGASVALYFVVRIASASTPVGAVAFHFAYSIDTIIMADWPFLGADKSPAEKQ